MNKCTIIGRLTKDPEQRTTQTGMTVANFTVAVDRRRKNSQEKEADFFRVTAWDKLGENCIRYLAKGRKVAVVGPVSVGVYTTQDGKTRANLEIVAQEVEFLSSKNEDQGKTDQDSGFQQVDEELPF